MTSPPLTRREYAYLRITGPGSHETITKILGLRPSEAWNVGDINSRNEKPRTSMSWRLSSGLDDSIPLDQHIDAIFLVMQVKAEGVRELWVDYDLQLQCVGYYPATGHGAHFDREKVRRATQLGLAIDLDFYFVDDFEHEV